MAKRTLEAGQGLLVPPLDDAYIHMGMARTLAQSGTWGVEAGAFVQASSSPLWTALLASAYRAFGPSVLPGIALGIVAAAGAIALGDHWLRRLGVSAWWRFAVLSTAVVVAPLAEGSFLAMEHSVQVLLVAALVVSGARFLADQSRSTGPIAGLLLCASLVRYESMAIGAAMSGLLFLQRRSGTAVTVATASVIGPIGVGLASVSQGGTFLPTGVVVKSSNAASWSFGDIVATVAAWPHLGWALLVGVVGMAHRLWHRRSLDEVSWAVTLFLTALAAQILVSRLGRFYRFETHLSFLAPIVLGPMLAGMVGPRVKELRIVGVLGFAGFGLWHAVEVHSTHLKQVGIIRRNPVEAARFLARNYAGSCVAIWDLGAVSFQGTNRLVDLAGLGSPEVLDAIVAGSWDSAQMERVTAARGCDVAVAFPVFLEASGGAPTAWVPVGAWSDEILAPMGHELTFYATQPSAVSKLGQSLRSWQLPQGVTLRLLHRDAP